MMKMSTLNPNWKVLPYDSYMRQICLPLLLSKKKGSHDTNPWCLLDESAKVHRCCDGGCFKLSSPQSVDPNAHIVLSKITRSHLHKLTTKVR